MSRVLYVKDHQEYKKNDILIFDGKDFVPVHKEWFLDELNAKVVKLEKAIAKLIQENNELKAIIQYDHGAITEEEFKELCGSKMQCNG